MPRLVRPYFSIIHFALICCYNGNGAFNSILQMRVVVYTSLLFFLLFVEQAAAAPGADTLACAANSCCCVNDPTPAGVMISHVHRENEWMISYRYMSMQMSGILAGTSRQSEDDVFLNYLMAPEKMRMDMHMLMGMYGITDRFTVMAMLNYSSVTMNMKMFSTSGHVHNGVASTSPDHELKASGLGDVKVHLMYGLVKKAYHQLLLSAGIGIPTGSVGIKGKNDDMMYPGKRLPYSMQLGSGTVDVLPCISYLYQQSKVTFSAQVSSVLRTQYNTIGYKLGNEITLNAWGAYQWLNFLSASLRMEAASSNRIRGYDPTLYYYNEPSANPYNYGGQRVNSYIGLSFNPKKGFFKSNRLGIEYGIPVYQQLNGIQMNQKQSLYASWAFTF